MNKEATEALKLAKEVLEATRILGWPEGKFVEICKVRTDLLGDGSSAIESIYRMLMGDAGEAVARIQTDFCWTDNRYHREVNRHIDVSDGSELLGFCNMLKVFKRTGAVSHHSLLGRCGI